MLATSLVTMGLGALITTFLLVVKVDDRLRAHHCGVWLYRAICWLIFVVTYLCCSALNRRLYRRWSPP